MIYRLHDVSRFPYVELRSALCRPGFAAEWGAEMDALLADEQAFVVAFEPSAINETPEDFKTRAIWFKTRRHLLPAHCAAMVAIVPSAEERENITADMAKRSRGFDVPYLAFDSFSTAEAATPALIAAVAQNPKAEDPSRSQKMRTHLIDFKT